MQARMQHRSVGREQSAGCRVNKHLAKALSLGTCRRHLLVRSLEDCYVLRRRLQQQLGSCLGRGSGDLPDVLPLQGPPQLCGAEASDLARRRLCYEDKFVRAFGLRGLARPRHHNKADAAISAHAEVEAALSGVVSATAVEDLHVAVTALQLGRFWSRLQVLLEGSGDHGKVWPAASLGRSFPAAHGYQLVLRDDAPGQLQAEGRGKANRVEVFGLRLHIVVMRRREPGSRYTIAKRLHACGGLVEKGGMAAMRWVHGTCCEEYSEAVGGLLPCTGLLQPPPEFAERPLAAAFRIQCHGSVRRVCGSGLAGTHA
mmetsp:Transcript_48260/g.151069  ORF Transcript_48260/g.151069 Transcript_48260/m.151069 type:complete len:314 (-) Transcript_48260:9-950(-)